ncbi:MAG: [FeFe] hydrogenase H-cluster maturation GTPase HydF [Ruminococcus sp.]|nr:[FeFe] hydrogenase H-cluster maturation GTPase HydF [Ruminococcus sp.]
MYKRHVLVTPIDEAAPKGRLILPQQQTIRDILDSDAMAVVTKEFQLEETLRKLGNLTKMVITDSQVFGMVNKIVPENIPLTSFSILMARYKGFLETAVKGASAINKLNDGDTVLISEGCTHHRQCGDIGSVKLPALLKKFTGKNIDIKLTSGREFPEDLSPYALVIHCGGCMLNEREVVNRMKSAQKQNIPFTNYGIAIAHMNGILKRSIEIFPELLKEVE